MSKMAARGRLEDALAEFLAKQELHDLVVGLHRGFDRLDDDLIVSSLASPFRYGLRVGLTPLEFAAHVRRMHTVDLEPTGLRLRYTQHALTNERYEIDGDVAYGECYAKFHGVTTDGRLITNVMRYVDRYVRVDGSWRLAERDPLIEWASPEFAPFVAQLPHASRRDRDDLSYRRDTGNQPA